MGRKCFQGRTELKVVMNDDQISQSEIRRVKDILGRKTVYSNAQRMNNSE